jgi:hypothetical protein
MNRRGAVVFYHPSGICSPMITDYGFVSVGASLEDSAIVLHHIARKLWLAIPASR